MKNGIIFLIFCCLFCEILKAEISLTFNKPAIIKFKPEDALDVTLSNSGKLVSCNFFGFIYNKQGNIINSFESSVFELQEGTSSFGFSSITSGSFSFSNSVISSFFQNHSYYPFDDYEISIGLKKYESNAILVKENYVFLGKLYPPALLRPFDGETVDLYSSLFNWKSMNPSILPVSDDFSYTFTMVKVDSFQYPYGAIAENYPVFTKDNITELYTSVSFQEVNMVRGSKYAWQVTGYVGGSMIGKSEAWEFRFDSSQIKADTIRISHSYYDFRKQNVWENLLIGDTIPVVISSSFNDTLLVTLKDMPGNKNTRSVEYKVPLTYGNNYLRLPLITKMEMEDRKPYMITLYAGEFFSKKIKFQYHK